MKMHLMRLLYPALLWSMACLCFWPGSLSAQSWPVFRLLEDEAVPTPRQLERRYGRPLVLKPLPDGLLEAFRWGFPPELALECPAQQALAASMWRAPAGASASSLLEAGLKRADDALLELRFTDALTELSQTRTLLPCLEVRLTVAQVRRLFVLEAVAHFYANDGQAERGFSELLAVDPRLLLEAEYPPKVQKLFFEVARKVARQPLTRVSFEGFEGKIFLNGNEVTGVRELAPGRHIVQLEGPLGLVRGAMLRIPDSTSLKQPTDLLAQRVALNPLPAASVRGLVKERLEKRQLPLSLKLASDRWLVQQGLETVGLVLPATSDGWSLWLLRRGEGMVEPDPALLAAVGLSSKGPSSEAPGRTEPDPFRKQQGDREQTSPGGLAVQVGAGVRSLRGLAGSAVGHPTQPTLLLAAAYPLRGFRLFLEAGLGLPGVGARSSGPDCGTDLTAEALETAQAQALTCLPGRLSFQLGSGVSLPILWGEQLRVEPRLSLQVLTLHEVVMQAGEPEDWQVAHVVAGGGFLGGMLSHRLPWDGRWWSLWLKLEGGGVLVPSPLGLSPLFLAGLQLGTEVAF